MNSNRLILAHFCAAALFILPQSCRTASIGSDLEALNGKVTAGYPYVVELASSSKDVNPFLKRHNEYRCTAFFVSPEWLMTTDNCVRGPKHSFRVTGSGLQGASIDKIVRYQMPSNDFDVAFLHLEGQTYSGRLPQLTLQNYAVGKQITFVGFGGTSRSTSACYLRDTRDQQTAPKRCAMVNGQVRPPRDVVYFGDSVPCDTNDVLAVLSLPANKRFLDLAIQACGEIKIEGMQAPSLNQFATYIHGPSVKNYGENAIAKFDERLGEISIALQANSTTHVGTIPLEGDNGGPIIVNDGGEKVIGLFSKRVVDTADVQALRDLNFATWLRHVSTQLSIPMDFAGIQLGQFNPIKGYQLVRQAPKNEQEIGQYNPAALDEDPRLGNIGRSYPPANRAAHEPVGQKPSTTTQPTGSAPAGGLKDCNADHQWFIQNPQASGICINQTSKLCYRYSEGRVRYEQGRFDKCPGSS